MSGNDWTGEERRGIPIHVLNYIDSKFDVHLTKVEEMVSDVQRVQNETLKQVTAFTAAQKQINEAFLEDHKGEPDYHGHRHDHLTRLKRARSWDDFWSDSFKKLGTGAVYSLGIVIGLVLWEAFKEAIKR